MGNLDVVFVEDARGFNQTFRSQAGEVAQELRKRANRVERAAARQVGVSTGRLRASISSRVRIDGEGLMAEVGVFGQEGVYGYAMMHHEGTRPHLIEASPGKHLRFARAGQVVFRSHVMHPGTRPNRYLADNLYLALV